MKQKLLSILLILALLTTLAPVSAFAENEPAAVTEEAEAQISLTPEPTAEPTPEYTQAPIPEPTAEPTLEPTVVPTEEPAVVEPTPELTEEPSPETAVEPSEEPEETPAVEPVVSTEASPEPEAVIDPNTSETPNPADTPMPFDASAGSDEQSDNTLPQEQDNEGSSSAELEEETAGVPEDAGEGPVEEESSAVVFAAELPKTEHYSSKETSSPEELFLEYVNSLFYPPKTRVGSKAAGRSAGSRLDGLDLMLYTALREQISLVAAGTRTSTVFTIDVKDLDIKKSWTAQDLGLETLFNDQGISEETIAAIAEKLPFSLSAIVITLMSDCPYELYWYDKTAGVEAHTYSLVPEADTVQVTGSFVFSFTVADEYSAGEYEVDPSSALTANAAAGNAQGIIAAAAEYPDEQKLRYYKNRICDLVSYDYTVAAGNVSYGNPWQLISVFDGDPGTNVVCEGYAKAFQYLCDYSSFSVNIECISVTGQLTASGRTENHMWNIVTLQDGLNYLADVTNCDAGTLGAPDLLFLVGCASGNTESGYSFSAGVASLQYRYDDLALSLYSQEQLTITNNNSYTQIEWTFSDGTLRIVGNGALPDLVLEYDVYAPRLWGCDVPAESIRAVIVEEGVTAIGSGTFDSFENLTTVTLPKSLISIGDWAFNCCPRLTSVEIPSGVKSIGDLAFASCSALKTVVLHEGLETIGREAFTQCSALRSISFPASLKRIEKNAFLWTSLESIVFHEGLEYIGGSAFSGAKITSLNLPSTLVQLGDLELEDNGGAFESCYNLTSIQLPSGLKVLGAYSFWNCQKLKTVELNEGLTSIGSYAFKDCFKLTGLHLPSTLKTIDSTSLACGHTITITVSEDNPYLSIAGSVILNSDRTVAMSYITGTPIIRIPETVTEIADYAFAESTVETVYLPSGLEKIGSHAFYNSQLWELYSKRKADGKDIKGALPNNLSSIGERAFEHTLMQEVTIQIPASVLEIGERALQGLRGVAVDNNNPHYMSYDGMLYDKTGELLIECPIYNRSLSSSSLKFHPNVRRIGNYAFSNVSCNTIVIPDTVESIGKMAFFCTDIESVAFGTGLTVIDEEAFRNALRLKQVSFAKARNLQRIEKAAFRDTAIRELVLPEGIRRIGDSSFTNCTELTFVYLPASLNELGESVFWNCYNLKTVLFCGAPPGFTPTVVIPEMPEQFVVYSFGNVESYTLVYLSDYQTQWQKLKQEWESDDIDNVTFLMLPVSKAPSIFNDTKDASKYFFAPVYWAAANGVTTGTSPTTFSPNAACTRSQIVTFLWRVMGEPEPSSYANPFRDVPSDAWYAKAVLWAYHSNITTGTSATTFGPNQACTRAQCVTFLWRAAGSPDAVVGNPFGDVKAGTYYYDAVRWAVANGITTGRTAKIFGVGQTCTRGQIVTFLYRYSH